MLKNSLPSENSAIALKTSVYRRLRPHERFFFFPVRGREIDYGECNPQRSARGCPDRREDL
jgi:hypothetical protein